MEFQCWYLSGMGRVASMNSCRSGGFQWFKVFAGNLWIRSFILPLQSAHDDTKQMVVLIFCIIRAGIKNCEAENSRQRIEYFADCCMSCDIYQIGAGHQKH